VDSLVFNQDLLDSESINSSFFIVRPFDLEWKQDKRDNASQEVLSFMKSVDFNPLEFPEDGLFLPPKATIFVPLFDIPPMGLIVRFQPDGYGMIMWGVADGDTIYEADVVDRGWHLHRAGHEINQVIDVVDLYDLRPIQMAEYDEMRSVWWFAWNEKSN
jgi:hypothetical protein